MTNQVFVLTTIDTEEEWDWNDLFPVTTPTVSNAQYLPSFQDLCTRHGMKPTYFVDFAVLENPVSRRIVEQLGQLADAEVGMHIHPWHTPPITAFDASSVCASFLHNHPAHVIREKLETVFSAFEGCGIRPTSFRGGRYSTGAAIQDFLHETRFIADCSIVPYTAWPDDGAPDFRSRDLLPIRRPAPREGLGPLWEIPLTLAFSRTPFRMWSRAFDIVEHSALGRLRLIGIAERLRLVRRIWLNFELPDSPDWIPFLRLLQAIGVPYVCLSVHSSSLVAGPGPYTRTRDDELRIRKKIESTFVALRDLPGFVPATASELAHHLETTHAGHRN